MTLLLFNYVIIVIALIVGLILIYWGFKIYTSEQ